MTAPTIAVIPFTFPTSTGGTFDITDATKLGGLTPKAAIFIANRATSLASEAANHGVGIGWTDGTRQYCFGAWSADNQANTAARRRSADTICAGVGGTSALSTGQLGHRASFNSFITNGVRLNADVGTIGAKGVAILFAGADVSARADLLTSIPNGTTDVTAPNFQPDLVFAMSVHGAFPSDTSAQADDLWTFGVATSNGNKSLAFAELNNNAPGGNPKVRVGSADCLTEVDSGGVVGALCTIDSFDSQGFTLHGNASSTTDVVYLAIKLGDALAEVADFTTPTATGVQSTVSGLSQTPNTVLAVVTGKTARDDTGTISATNASANFAISAFNSTAADTVAGRVDVADPSDTGDYQTSGALQLGAHNAATSIAATLNAFSSGGFSLNYSAVSASNQVGWALAIGPGTPPAASGVRDTQAGSYLGLVPDPDARVTQAGAYVGVKGPASGDRVTQAGSYVGLQATADNDLRITQGGLYVGVRLERPDCDTAECQAWRIERTDGVVFRFTTHDKAVTVNGESYSPCQSLSTSAFQASSELGSTDNVDMSGVITDTSITRADLWAGRFDGATVSVFRVDWITGAASLIAAGQTGSLSFGTTEFKFEVTTAGQRLQQKPLLQEVTPTCRFKLGDSRCTVDLEALRVSGHVTATVNPNVFTAANRRAFTDSSRAEPNDYFKLGRLTWTSGDNVGQSMDVKIYTGSQFLLERPLEYAIEVGDAYTVVPGCDRVFQTCIDKFNNAINFGGFPHLRGSDDLIQPAPVKQP